MTLAWIAARAPGTFSRIQAILLAEKYGSGTRPVLAATVSARPRRTRSAIIGSVRRHCQQMALHTGSPVRRSHTTVVSRWLVMPTAAMRSE